MPGGTDRIAMAVVAHPDDIEFYAAGTLLLLREAGYAIHYMNLSSGNCGSVGHGPEETRRARETEAREAASILGATFHPGFCDDLEIVYEAGLLRRLAAVIREVRPRVLLTHSLEDYMEDHTNTARLAVTAAFSRGMPNFVCDPPHPPFSSEVTVYHAMPHGLRDAMRRRVIPGAFADTTQVQKRKREALAAHRSQKEWLDVSQGMDSYLVSMDAFSREMGRLSGTFRHAEGWRRHSHIGFGSMEEEPLAEALGPRYLVNQDYERLLDTPSL